jgi:hypothetical protein
MTAYVDLVLLWLRSAVRAGHVVTSQEAGRIPTVVP